MRQLPIQGKFGESLNQREDNTVVKSVDTHLSVINSPPIEATPKLHSHLNYISLLTCI